MELGQVDLVTVEFVVDLPALPQRTFLSLFSISALFADRQPIPGTSLLFRPSVRPLYRPRTTTNPVLPLVRRTVPSRPGRAEPPWRRR